MALFRAALGKLRQGLAKTRDILLMDVRDLVPFGRALDDELISEIEARLLRADVGAAATTRLIDGIRADYKSGKMTRGEQVLEYLKREIKAMWPEEDRRLRFAPPGAGPTVVLVTGINGAGKTTTIAKLCHLLRGEGRRVLLAACDTFRAGAVRQLEIWGERLGVEVIRGQQGGDPAAVAFDACKAAVARGVDVLIIDTAGRLHTQDPLMRQLGKIRAVVGRQIPGAPHETLLVLDATSGQNALRQAEEFSKAAELTGLVLAKLDGTAKGGIVVAIRGATRTPVKFVGVGETPADLAPFDPDDFVEALFGGGAAAPGAAPAPG
ncbi:MAG TPA: signal recognition particle-docking protein FtsY [Phycisphaerales bacterium]|nr:signal recognition particle-docking protein FtsY [Phycisphaerales bacterium]